MEDEMERTLRKEIPPCLIERLEPGGPWSTSGLNGWSLIDLGGGPFNPAWTGTIDLSGYAKDFKTFYPHGGVIQEGPYFASLGNGGTIDYTIVSSVPLDPASVLTAILFNTAPGFMSIRGLVAAGFGDQQNWETVIFAESNLLVPNTNISPNLRGILQSIERRQSGSLAPTASDTLHVLRLIVSLSAESELTYQIPASRVILPGVMGQEPDLEYMMRLSRSVEHLSTPGN